ncbi:type VI secretion system baseplate subunit TssG [Acidomonas methanolica]|uniref:type VI secretion system baseplate subunit TssG n=1 Tax=Acidomonas methanolica TaxID=437 RepID=UPI00211A07F5|nr:type VI secretion system baseplate subunit TssG [Acidomonas methanolica]MCQ9154966.1 type VI secretion system baseplate subunit TssG [Acidomonas methanolica]
MPFPLDTTGARLPEKPDAGTVGADPRADEAPSRALAALIEMPGRFSFDAAMALLHSATGVPLSQSVRFRTPPGLATPWRDILEVRPLPDGTYEVTIGFGGLTGHDGVLPRHYSAMADEAYRARSPALAAFLDLLAQRPRVQFAEAGMKYTARAAIRAESGAGTACALDRALLSLIGVDPAKGVALAGFDTRHLLYFSGLLATRPRSAERLRTLLEEWVRAPVHVEQFVGQWISVPPDQQSRLPGPKAGQFSQLGVDAVIGACMWEMNARIEIVIGPLTLNDFRAFAPAGECHDSLAALIRFFVDDDVECVVRLGLKREEVPKARTETARLGIDGWLAQTAERTADAYDVFFPVSTRQ